MRVNPGANPPGRFAAPRGRAFRAAGDGIGAAIFSFRDTQRPHRKIRRVMGESRE
jgi:hypothetical protein